MVVRGVCEVSAGYATVNGNIEVDPGGILAAAFGRNFRTHSLGSGLRVNGGILALAGSTVILGCTPKEFVCLDGTGSSHEVVTGDIEANSALGMLVYNSSIGGDVSQNGGGGGFRCARTGPFARFGDNVFSTYESDTISGVMKIDHVASCYLAIAKVHVGGSLSLIADHLANPDAIEVTSDRIGVNLICRHNSHVWDSEGYHPTKAYPRLPKPDRVGGAREGQCVLASPVASGQPSGPGPF